MGASQSRPARRAHRMAAQILSLSVIVIFGGGRIGSRPVCRPPTAAIGLRLGVPEATVGDPRPPKLLTIFGDGPTHRVAP
jgi:hypothetical protein